MLKSTREAISRQNRHMRASGYSRRKCPGSHTAGIPITGSWTYTHYCSVCKAAFHVDAAGNVPYHMFWYKSTEAYNRGFKDGQGDGNCEQDFAYKTPEYEAEYRRGFADGLKTC